jgi:hypothetical protein
MYTASRNAFLDYCFEIKKKTFNRLIQERKQQTNALPI